MSQPRPLSIPTSPMNSLTSIIRASNQEECSLPNPALLQMLAIPNNMVFIDSNKSPISEQLLKTIDFVRLTKSVVTKSGVSMPAILVALVYIRRYCYEQTLDPKRSCERVLLGALMAATKDVTPKSYQTIDWVGCSAKCFTLQEMKANERDFLEKLHTPHKFKPQEEDLLALYPEIKSRCMHPPGWWRHTRWDISCRARNPYLPDDLDSSDVSDSDDALDLGDAPDSPRPTLRPARFDIPGVPPSPSAYSCVAGHYTPDERDGSDEDEYNGDTDERNDWTTTHTLHHLAYARGVDERCDKIYESIGHAPSLYRVPECIISPRTFCKFLQSLRPMVCYSRAPSAHEAARRRQVNEAEHVLYVGLTPFIFRRLAKPESRTILLFSCGVLALSRIGDFMLRARAANNQNNRVDQSLVTYLQTTYSVGFIYLSHVLLRLLGCMLSNAGNSDTLNGWSMYESTDEESLKTLEDDATTTMVQLQHLGVLSLGAASGALYMQTITDLDKMHLVKMLRHVAAVDVIIVAELIRGLNAFIMVACTCFLSTIAIYRLAVMRFQTDALKSMRPGSLNDVSSKATFYIFHMLPEYLVFLLLFRMNVRDTYPIFLRNREDCIIPREVEGSREENIDESLEDYELYEYDAIMPYMHDNYPKVNNCRPLSLSRCQLISASILYVFGIATIGNTTMATSSTTDPALASSSFFSNILTPGSSLHPTFLFLVDGAFGALLLVLLSLAIMTRGNLHFFALMAIEVALWASVKWFVHELQKVQPEEQGGRSEVTGASQTGGQWPAKPKDE
ncbi:hypothetical protein POSPLADRAFT_1047931 [Postia placenta MAD-698-R-SB12]|uniref:Cyclin N-terminal domain-containing protein n=1 Tax=Postia placenta MAD-698-R-SB12 TaxID=670580 RepID=A0A1X6MW83_9APHY|nr:hypothetical protein POSPLADRAFT_1047931 [Postia placenta MAD-698-R-SB12]OSX60500.1 hypothetical protein POSPLADRAFT_1047931 [Postia placenta MAD-698-R-SB12]